MSKSIWLLSAGILGLATPAHAQDAPAPADQTAPTQEASDANPDNATGGDIVITATRRNALLSDVPLAVSAVTAETLENTGANDIRQLNQVAPSLLVSSTGS